MCFLVLRKIFLPSLIFLISSRRSKKLADNNEGEMIGLLIIILFSIIRYAKIRIFITGHYLNTQPELVKRMIDEGHIVGNQFTTMVMYHI